MYQPYYTPEAKHDIRIAAKWYNEQRSGLGKRFTAAIQGKLNQLCAFPKSAVIKYDDIRTAPVQVFPYMIHYRIKEEGKRVIVIGVYSMFQNPLQWKSRSL